MNCLSCNHITYTSVIKIYETYCKNCNIPTTKEEQQAIDDERKKEQMKWLIGFLSASINKNNVMYKKGWFK